MGGTAMLVATIASVVVSAVGVGMSALSSAAQQRQQADLARQQAAYARSMAERNAAIAEYAAKSVEGKGAYEAGLARERARKLLSKQIALTGASGVDIYGSPLEVMKQSGAEGERDAEMILYNAHYDAWKYRTGGETSLLEGNSVASRYDSQASSLNSSAGTSILTGVAGVGGSLLKGIGQYASYSGKSGSKNDASGAIPWERLDYFE